jgi:hypothetical protein
MKKFPKLFLFIACFAPVLFVGCGKNSDQPATTGVAAVNSGICAQGQVYSAQYGCLAVYQGYNYNGYSNNSNGVIYGNYNGQAVPATCWAGTVATQSGCFAQGSQGNCPAGQVPYQYPGSSTITCVQASGYNSGYNSGSNSCYKYGGGIGTWTNVPGYGWDCR